MNKISQSGTYHGRLLSGICGPAQYTSVLNTQKTAFLKVSLKQLQEHFTDSKYRPRITKLYISFSFSPTSPLQLQPKIKQVV